MRPLVLEATPPADAQVAEVAPVRGEPAVAEAAASVALPLGAIPEPVLNVLVTVEEAARFLEMNEGLVVDLTKWGTLPCLRSGETRYLRFADVVAHRRICEERRRLDREDPLDAVRDMIIAEGLYDTP